MLSAVVFESEQWSHYPRLWIRVRTRARTGVDGMKKHDPLLDPHNFVSGLQD